jgi:glycosyltransferase involved in cell wall biosynthesis
VEPRISIVIPTYKRPVYLERAINSVFAQTYASWELIIVDDNAEGSEHRFETEAFMVRYSNDPRVRYLKHTSNQGGSAARNTGVREAVGEFIAFLDDDDEWLPEKLERQMAVFQQGGADLGLVYSARMKVDGTGEKVELELPSRRGFVFPDILVRNFIGTTSTVLCRRSALCEVECFDASLPAAQDFDLYIRLTQRYRVDFVDVPLVKRYVHNGERITGNPVNKVKAYDAIHRKYAPLYAKYPEQRSQFFYRYGKKLMTAGERERAETLFREAYRANPRNWQSLGLMLIAGTGAESYGLLQKVTRPVRNLVRRLFSSQNS